MALLCAPGWQVFAEDWPQAQGVLRDNKSTEVGLLAAWPEAGPELAWTFSQAGLGYSGPAVVGERVFMMGAREGKTEVFALQVADGAEVWKVTVNEKPFDFKGNAWGIGPRSTPTVADGRVFALAGDGELLCCDTNGQVQWHVNMVNNLGGEVDPIGGGPKVYGWGYCWSPLVDGDKLICVPGGAGGMVAALDTKTGDVLWRSRELTEMATYSSPLLASIHGVQQYVLLTPLGVAAVSAEDGKLLWHYKRSQPYSDVVIPTPIVQENSVYVSTGDGCELIEVSMENGVFSAADAYTSKASRNMKNNLGGFVLLDGYVYGCSDRRGWVCQELNSGDIAWYKRGAGGFGDGSIVYADGHLYLFAEREGEVGLIEAASDEWSLKSRFTLPELSEQRAASGRAWTHPVIANGRLYLRDQELFYCYKVK